MRAQLDAVLSDIPPGGAKTGALGNAAVIDAVADLAVDFSFPLVGDPVMISKHGASLLEHDAAQVLRNKLLPHAFPVTPNLPEATALAGFDVTDSPSMERAVAAIGRLGPKNVLIKGGHLGRHALDVLWCDGQIQRFESEHIVSKNTHGTGCVYSAAITACLARGEDLVAAVEVSKWLGG